MFHQRNEKYFIYETKQKTNETKKSFHKFNSLIMRALDTKKFSEMIRAKRGNNGLRAIAQEIGNVSAPTLSRIEQGNLPDLDTYFRVCEWLGVSTDFFVLGNESNDNNKKEVVAHLRADKTLPLDTAEALIKMINLAYESVNKGLI